MQAQAGQGLKLLTRPGHPGRHEALGRRQHGIGGLTAADAPQQAVGLQAGAGAGLAGRVTAVLGQQHPDVHLVALGLQVLEEAFDTIPMLVPLAVPVGRALDHPFLLLGGQLVPGRVTRDAGRLGMAHQVVLALGPGRGLHGLDGAGPQRELVVRDHQAVIHPDHTPEATAHLAGAHGRVEGERRWDRLAVMQVAVGAVQAGGIAPQLGFGVFARQGIDVQAATAALERGLDRLDHPHLLGVACPQAVGHHVQHLAWAGGRGHLALGLHPGETAGRQPLAHLVGRGAGRQFDRKGQDQARLHPVNAGRLGPRQQLGVDGLGRIVAHGLRGLSVEQGTRTRKQELQVIVQLGHRAHGGARTAHRVGLVDCNGRRHALHPVHGGLVHAVQELARIGREGLDIAPLPLGVQGVEHQARLARTTGPRDHGQLTRADVQIKVLEVVLAGTADFDDSLGHGRLVPVEAKHSRQATAMPA